ADQIDGAVKARRNAELLAATTGGAAERSARLAGRTMEVLVDGVSRKDPRAMSGRTDCNRVVNFDGRGAVTAGDFVHVRIIEVLPHSLRGALVSVPEEAVCFSR
ncbi:MAG: TRAM domain-containing protein, partial [Acidobacteriia bacterium]|nr:TRAM domain-containing protein [Terriglobia bacterium]